MKLKEILNNLDCEIIGNINLEIDGIENNTNKLKKNYLFVCIKGFKVDGHSLIDVAIQNGAIAIVVDESFDKVLENVTIIKCKNTRFALSICSSNFYKNPSKNLKLIGITGTKGKTTTTYLLKSILEKAGKKVGLIGTIENSIGMRKIENAHRTTPESIELQRLFCEMNKEDVEYVVMEVSSQALKLDRVAGLNFEVAAFTNFSEDHIGANEHPDMDDYFCSKLKLFNMCKKSFINTDDDKIYSAINLINENALTYSIKRNSDFVACNIEFDSTKTQFDVKFNGKQEHYNVNIPGEFTVYNSMTAIAICKYFRNIL